MKNRELKKQQRFVNWLVRKWNKSIANDNMYNGCFKLIQTERRTIPYCDGSGESMFIVRFEFISTKTGEVIDSSKWIKVFEPDRGSFLKVGVVNSKLFDFINAAIVEKAKFWENKEKWL